MREAVQGGPPLVLFLSLTLNKTKWVAGSLQFSPWTTVWGAPAGTTPSSPVIHSSSAYRGASVHRKKKKKRVILSVFLPPTFPLLIFSGQSDLEFPSRRNNCGRPHGWPLTRSPHSGIRREKFWDSDTHTGARFKGICGACFWWIFWVHLLLFWVLEECKNLPTWEKKWIENKIHGGNNPSFVAKFILLSVQFSYHWVIIDSRHFTTETEGAESAHAR